jgi:hypothetical protein
MSPQEGGNDMNDHFYSPSALPLMQSLLATLADIDFAHECDLQRLATGSVDPALKGRVRAQLEASHPARRAPYVQQLGVLEARIEPACRT